MKNRGWKKLGIILFWLLVWQIAAMTVGNDFLLPSPLTTLARLFALAGTLKFWQSALYTLCRVLGGFALAVLAGSLLAAATAAWPFFAMLFRPLRSIIKSTPVTSFILLVLLWFSKGRVPLFISFLMVLPIIWASLETAILNTDAKLLEMASLFRFGFAKTVRLVYAPAFLPAFRTACATGIGFAWKAGVAAEVLAMSPISIGRNLYESKLYLETPDLFAWTVLIILLSVLLETLMTQGLARLGRRDRKEAP